MSAEEIKSLAQQAAADKISNKVASHYGMAESCSMYETALLAYAAMVERCEEVRRKHMKHDQTNAYDHVAIDTADYILKGDAEKIREVKSSSRKERPMAEKRNALAELAERLNNGYVSLVVNGRQVATFATAAFPELEKVQRIVAELAKPDRIDGRIACEIMMKCRAIAEETR